MEKEGEKVCVFLRPNPKVRFLSPKHICCLASVCTFGLQVWGKLRTGARGKSAHFFLPLFLQSQSTILNPQSSTLDPQSSSQAAAHKVSSAAASCSPALLDCVRRKASSAEGERRDGEWKKIGNNSAGREKAISLFCQIICRRKFSPATPKGRRASEPAGKRKTILMIWAQSGHTAQEPSADSLRQAQVQTATTKTLRGINLGTSASLEPQTLRRPPHFRPHCEPPKLQRPASRRATSGLCVWSERVGRACGRHAGAAKARPAF